MNTLDWDYNQMERKPKWYEMAAQQGNGEALYTLGRMYYSGVMVNVDYDKALYFFKKLMRKNYRRPLII